MSYSHEWGMQRHFFLAPPPGALGRGQKVKYNQISITKSISKILYQTLCLFSQMKDTKHIRRDLNSVAWVMPQGSDFGVLGCRGGKKIYIFFKHCHVVYQIDGDDEQNKMQVKFSSYGQTGDLGVRSKGQISFNFGLHVNFKDIFTKVCVCCTNNKYKTHQTGFSFCHRGHAPGVGLWGAGDAQGGQQIIFPNMVTWHIKSTGMTSRTKCK